MLLEPYVCDQRAFIPYFEQQYINLQKKRFFCTSNKGLRGLFTTFQRPGVNSKNAIFPPHNV